MTSLLGAPKTLASAATLAAIMTACGPALFLQDDGFRDRMKTGCETIDACEALQQEATKRVRECKKNTVGYVRCDDAREDLGVVTRWLRTARGLEKQREAEAQAEETHRQDEASAGALRVEEWIEGIASKCAEALALDPCHDVPEGADDSDVARCETSCEATIGQERERTYAAALNACVHAVGYSDGTMAAKCEFTAHPRGPTALADRAAACAEECAARGAEIVASIREEKARAEQARAEQARKEEERHRQRNGSAEQPRPPRQRGRSLCCAATARCRLRACAAGVFAVAALTTEASAGASEIDCPGLAS